MSNLIVSGGGWEPHRDSFGSGRVLEYTDAAIAQRVMPNKVLNINAVAPQAGSDAASIPDRGVLTEQMADNFG